MYVSVCLYNFKKSGGKMKHGFYITIICSTLFNHISISTSLGSTSFIENLFYQHHFLILSYFQLHNLKYVLIKNNKRSVFFVTGDIRNICTLGPKWVKWVNQMFQYLPYFALVHWLMHWKLLFYSNPFFMEGGVTYTKMSFFKSK